jgi:hypothetical protein
VAEPRTRPPQSPAAQGAGGRESGRPGSTADGPPGPEDLLRYRRAVEETVRRLADRPAGPAVDGVADQPGVRSVLERVPGGVDRAVTRIEQQMAGFRANTRSNAATPQAMLRILLLQQVEVLWWGSVPPFLDDDAVLSSPELVSLATLRRRGLLAFHYRVGTNALPRRARDYAMRRWAPGREPRSSGLSHPLARPAMVAVLNEVAGRFAQAAPHWPGGLWVNCIVRSTSGQLRLQQLGYSALLPSAHCTGWAADLEMDWLRRHGVAGALQDVLTDYRDDGVLNVIDEGQAWHVSLNPAAVDGYAAAAPRPGTRRGR